MTRKSDAEWQLDQLAISLLAARLGGMAEALQAWKGITTDESWSGPRFDFGSPSDLRKQVKAVISRYEELKETESCS